MRDEYEILLGPLAMPGAGDSAAGTHRAFGWDHADGAGPDRLFNRYRRLRLDALALACIDAGIDAGTDPIPRCPAAPSAGRG